MRAKCALGAALALVAAVFLFSGCILSTEDEETTPKPTRNYLPLTDKENVIHNLLESYKWADIDRYVELLHADYIWYNQPEDVVVHGLPPQYTRAEDSTITHNIFRAKLGTHEDPNMRIETLGLLITSGRWDSVPEVGGAPCDDCWETTRLYQIAVQTETTTWTGNGLVKFIVVSVPVDEQKLYKLYRGDDILSN